MYLLGDIGGTKTRLIFCKSEKDLKQTKNLKIFNTPQNYKEFLKLLEDFVKLNSHFLKKMRKAVFGFAGMFDKRKEKLIYAPNLRDFENKNLKRDLEKILSSYKSNNLSEYTPNNLSPEFNTNSFGHNLGNQFYKVILENDAVLAGLGEGRFGAGKIFDSFGYITLSTGVGGAKIINTRTNTNFSESIRTNDSSQEFASNNEVRDSLCEGLQEFASNKNTFGSEPGHSFLLIKDFLFEAEELLGGENIRKIFGKKPEEIKDKKFWNYYHQILSIFLINVSIFWSVDKIILGGSLVKKISLNRVKSYINKFCSLPLKIHLQKSVLGDLAAIYGSLVKLKNR